jgi:hypothetical protein
VTDTDRPTDWRASLATALLVFAIAASGCTVAFALWLNDLVAPQMALLGSGNRLSVFVSDGPARLILATGDDPVAYENALTRFRPIFARRVDVLLLAGSDRSLLVPVAAHADPHVRLTTALAPLPPSPEATAVGPVPALTSPRRIQLGPSLSVTVETALPFGVDATTTFPAWRATIARAETRIVVLSDGAAAALFPPDAPASVLAVSGDDPVAAWDLAPAVALVANSEAIGGPELRSAFAASHRPPQWGLRVFPGEALRLRFIDGGVEISSETAQSLAGTPAATQPSATDTIVRLVRRRGRPWRARIRLSPRKEALGPRSNRCR